VYELAMPYPESCPECGGVFRNTGTHFTARRNELGRHVLLELGCQNTSRRFWWDFTTGHLSVDGRPSTTRTPTREPALAAAHGLTNGLMNGTTHVLENKSLSAALATSASDTVDVEESAETEVAARVEVPPVFTREEETPSVEPIASLQEAPLVEPAMSLNPAAAPGALKDAFIRQLQLDRMTLRQMRSLLVADEARRAIEVAVGATEATYERLSLILFGADLPQLLGKPATGPAAPSLTAEERLELQREKARIRARLRRAAIKAAKQAG
jgi:hypothetical protein